MNPKLAAILAACGALDAGTAEVKAAQAEADRRTVENLHAVGNPIGVREPQVPLEMPRTNTAREQARRLRQAARLAARPAR